AHKTREHPPFGQPHFADGQIHRKTTAILALPNDFAADSDDFGVTCPEVIRKITVVLGTIRRGHQNRHIPTDDFAGLITKDSFGGSVYRLDEAALVNGDDAFDGGFKDRAYPLARVAQLGCRRPRAG